MALPVGAQAPDFTLTDFDHQPYSSENLRGHTSVLVFIPFPFSSVCAGELCEIRDHYSHLSEMAEKIVAITCDTFFTNKAWAEHESIPFPILSDFWPHGEVARAYDCFDENLGCATRATYVLDPDGKITHVFTSEELLKPRALADLRQALVTA